MIGSLVPMLPYYLLGNVHCLGMCGPIAMMVGKRGQYYLLGRAIAFTLGGFFAASFGALMGQVVWLSALLCFVMGSVMIAAPFVKLSFGRWLAPVERRLTKLLIEGKRGPTLALGAMALFLPCGQSLVVWSYCAVLGRPLLGLVHGLVFALLTTPSLLFAMQAKRWIQKYSLHCHRILAALSVMIGLIAWCRGLAELELVPHLVLYEGASLHLVLW